METKPTSQVVQGVIISLLMIVFGLVIYFTNQMQNKALSSIQYVILIAGIIWSCITYAKQLNGNVTFGNVFAHGFKVTAVVIVLVAVYTFCALKFLFPDMLDKILDAAKKGMEEKGNMTDDQMQQGLAMTRKFIVPFAIGGTIIIFGIIGAISAAIGAAVAKKNPEGPFNPIQ